MTDATTALSRAGWQAGKAIVGIDRDRVLAPQWFREQLCRGLLQCFAHVAPRQCGTRTVARARAPVALPSSTQVTDELDLLPTARPIDVAPPTRTGLYVFCFFDVRNGDDDEIVQLSHTAWKAFEANADYAAEPQGLFRERSGADGGRARARCVRSPRSCCGGPPC